jgi:hypothetical protein
MKAKGNWNKEEEKSGEIAQPLLVIQLAYKFRIPAYAKIRYAVLNHLDLALIGMYAI